MKEASIGGDQSLIAHNQTADMAKPRERALDHPPPAIPPQLPAVLMGRPPLMAAGRDHGLNPPASQAGPQGIAVIAPIRNQAVGPLAGPPGLPGRPTAIVSSVCSRRVTSTGDAASRDCSQRSTRAIDQNHPLGALAPLGLADFGPPCSPG
jgi:hypothetical protein